MRFSDPQTSLLVRATNWLGDAVMTTPALAGVREGFPDARIVLLAKPLVAELFRHHPGRRRGARLRAARSPRGKRAAGSGWARSSGAAGSTGAASPERVRRGAPRLPRADPERAGYPTDGRRLLLSLPIPLPRDIFERHEVEYYLCLLDGLGILVRYRGVEARRDGGGEGGDGGASCVPRHRAGAPLVAINRARRTVPRSGGSGPVRRRRGALSEEWGARVVVLGSAAEAPLAGRSRRGAKGRRQPGGEDRVREIMALLSLSCFLVTNDSGPMHIGAPSASRSWRSSGPPTGGAPRRGLRLPRSSGSRSTARPADKGHATGSRVHARRDARHGDRGGEGTSPAGPSEVA